MDDVSEIQDLASPNWSDAKYRRRIAACLVNVVYLLENARLGNAQKEEERMRWCDILKFHVKEKIQEHIPDGTIFGAVFEWVGGSNSGGGGEEPPLEVVAFRGTILNRLDKDFHHDWKAIMARHGSISRVDIGLPYLKNSIQKHGPRKIWIAGHSLGAAIAMAAARRLPSIERDEMEAHFFNPPFLSPRFPEVIFFARVGKFLAAVRDGPPPSGTLEEVYKKIKGACKWVAVRSGLNDDTRLRELCSDFIGIGGWIPNIYVNTNDPICCSYIRYFKVMQGIYKQKSQPLHERMKYLFCYEVAKDRTPLHLFPSAKLFVKKSKNHKLSQWWRSVDLQGTEYLLPVEVTIETQRC